MALHILGKNLKRNCINFYDGRALLFFANLSSFLLFSSIWQQWRFSWGAFFFLKIQLHGAFNRVRMCVVGFLCSTLCVFQIRRQLESCCSLTCWLLLHGYKRCIWCILLCIFLIASGRTAILNHKAGEFSIFYFLWDSQGESAKEKWRHWTLSF